MRAGMLPAAVSPTPMPRPVRVQLPIGCVRSARVLVLRRRLHRRRRRVSRRPLIQGRRLVLGMEWFTRRRRRWILLALKAKIPERPKRAVPPRMRGERRTKNRRARWIRFRRVWRSEGRGDSTTHLNHQLEIWKSRIPKNQPTLPPPPQKKNINK